MQYYPLNHGTRAELDLTLDVIDGHLPTDLSGYLFVNSAAGTVNSTTPPPEDWPDGSPCEEYGATNLNGDGLLYRFDFSAPGRITLRSRLLKTACYYADEATRYGTEYYKEGLHFKSQGLSRTHKDLGTRNQVNTAVVPFRFGPDQPAHLCVTFDAGRPHLIDPVGMDVLTPIGGQPEWLQNFPDEMEQVFPMIYATAHPAFDPYTYDYYAVNYQKSLINLLTNTEWDHTLMKAASFLVEEVETFADWLTGQRFSPAGLVDAVRQFVPFLNNKHTTSHKEEFSDHYQAPSSSPVASELRLVHWKGGKLNSWRVVDAANGVGIAIDQTMHQMDLTKDYILITDSTLKFAMDLLVSLPFGHHDRLNDLLRRITTHTIRPRTPCYLIRRADLTRDAESVSAVHFELPHETIHFSLDYRNPDDRITLYTGHNSATCGGEWVRPFDRLAIDPNRPPAADRIGGMATSVMDISRMGKYIIRGTDGKILDEKTRYEKGFPGDRVEDVHGPHTWGAGLATYRGQDSPTEKPDRILQLYQLFDGLDGEVLTQFIYRLYANHGGEQGVVPTEKLLAYHRHGVPGCLCRVDTETLTLADHYLAGAGEQIRSLQFIPRRREGAVPEGADPATDGYIAALVMVRHPNGDPTGYSRQLYLFDAADLAGGPVCRLTHDDLAWSQTIHGAYVESIAPPTLNYRVDVKEDHEWVVDRFVNAEKQQRMRAFLREAVYPEFA